MLPYVVMKSMIKKFKAISSCDRFTIKIQMWGHIDIVVTT